MAVLLKSTCGKASCRRAVKSKLNLSGSFTAIHFPSKGSPSYSSTKDVWYTLTNIGEPEHPRTIMNGAYSTIFDTNIPGARHVLCAP